MPSLQNICSTLLDHLSETVITSRHNNFSMKSKPLISGRFAQVTYSRLDDKWQPDRMICSMSFEGTTQSLHLNTWLIFIMWICLRSFSPLMCTVHGKALQPMRRWSSSPPATGALISAPLGTQHTPTRPGLNQALCRSSFWETWSILLGAGRSFGWMPNF